MIERDIGGRMKGVRALAHGSFGGYSSYILTCQIKQAEQIPSMI
jgi:hypothetical protein